MDNQADQGMVRLRDHKQDYIKDRKERLELNVYQKNARAISFYQREGFIIQCEGLDEATGEKEYTMLCQYGCG